MSVKKKIASMIISILLFLFISTPAFACTGIYVGSEASEDGTIIIARSNDNADVWPNYMTITDRAEKQGDRTMPVDNGKTVFAPIPETTYKYTSTPWMDSTNTAVETVSEETAAKAMIIIKNLKLNKVGDAFLYASALNVMNRYVKQSSENKKTIGYYFKRCTEVIVNYLVRHPDDDVRLEIQMDQGMTLMVAEIFGIQFSFHQITVTEQNSKFKAADFDHPSIPWDGIRKQQSANTLFYFALSHDFDRTDVLMDGTPLFVGIESTLKKLSNNELSLPDLKISLFSGKTVSSEKSVTNEEVKFAQAQSKYSLRFKNLPIAVLYENTLEGFIGSIKDRSLVNFLTSQFEDGYGVKIPLISTYALKYSIINVLNIIEQGPFNPNCGVKIEYYRNRIQDCFLIVFSSYGDDGKINTSIMQLIDWFDVKPGSDPSKVEYRGHTDSEGYSEGVNPSIMLRNYLSTSTHGIVDDQKFNFEACTFFFDTSNESYGLLRGNDQNGSSVFYSTETDKVRAFILKSISGDNGLKALKEIQKLANISRSRHGLTEDQEYAFTTTMDLLNENRPFIITIDGRKGSGKTTLIDVLKSIMEKRKEVLVTADSEKDLQDEECDLFIYDTFIPESIDFEKHRGNIVLFDPFIASKEEFDKLLSLREEADTLSIVQKRLSFSTCPCFADDGAGNNWLIRHLQLGMIVRQSWNPGDYKIEVLDSLDNVSEEDGIYTVVFPDDITYNAETNTIEYSDNQISEIYKELAKGVKGVRIYSADAALKAFIKKEVTSELNKYNWLKNVQGDYSNLLEAQSDLLDNSIVRNKYETVIISHVGADNWNKISDDSKRLLISGLLTFNDLYNYDQTMDFSGVVIQLTKIFEKESSRRYAIEYVDFLKEKYGDDFMVHVPSTLKRDGCDVLTNLHQVMMGSLPHIAGIGRGSIENQEYYDEFIEYWEKKLFSGNGDPEKGLLRALGIIDNIRYKYRNYSAHQEFLPATLALECIQNIITEKCMFKELFDLYNH